MFSPSRKLLVRRAIGSALALFVLCGFGSAQSSNGPVTTLQATSRIVYVDIVVHDGYGHLVHNLKPSDFQITENGQPQRIRLFEEHTAATALAEAAHDPVNAPASAPPRMITNVPTAQSTQPLDMILLDLLDTPSTEQAFARAHMISFLRSVPAGHRVALFILSDRLHMVQGFTSSSAELAAAAHSVRVRDLGHTRTAADRINDHDMIGMIDSSLDGGQWGVRGTSFLGGAIQRELDQEDRGDMKTRLDRALDAFQQLARAVNGVHGRKNLFWLAGEFPSSTYFTLQSISATQVGTGNSSSAGATPGPGGSGIGGGGAPGVGAVSNNFTGLDPAADDSLHPFSERVDHLVGDSQIAVYPIDLTGIETDSIGAGSSGIGSAGASTGGTTSAMWDRRFDDRVAMNQIADETGGHAFYGNNDASQMLQQGFADGENFYTVAYQPTNTKWNGNYRKIRVNLSVPNTHLSYRRGYFALPAQAVGNPRIEFASAMRLETPPSTMLTVSAAPPVRLGADVMQLDATLGLGGVTFTPAKNDDRKARLQVMLVAYPLNQSVQPYQTNDLLQLSLSGQDFQRVLSTGVSLEQRLHLKPGKYVLRLGVLDTLSGRIGTLTLPFVMPSA